MNQTREPAQRLPAWVRPSLLWAAFAVVFVVALIVQDHLSGVALVACWAAVVIVAVAAWAVARQRGHLRH